MLPADQKVGWIVGVEKLAVLAVIQAKAERFAS